MDSETSELSGKIEYKSENGKFYTEGFLEVAGDVDLVGDVFTENCIKSIVSQCVGKEMNAVTSSTATRKAMKMSADHAHLNPKLGGDRREMPVGKIVDAKEVKEGGKSKAWIKTEVNEFHPEFKSIKGCIENGYFDAYSIEFFPIDAVKSGNKRIVNDARMTGAAYTGRPILPSANMTDHYTKSFSFEQFKSMMDKEKEDEESEDFKKEYETQKKEHPTVPDMFVKQIAKDHIRLGMAGKEGKSDGKEHNKSDFMEEKKSDTIAPSKEEVKAEVKMYSAEEVKAMIAEELKSHDLKTLEQTKSVIAEEIKKNAEELKSKVLMQKEEKKSAPKNFFEQLAQERGFKV